jgi:hypothetical protein
VELPSNKIKKVYLQLIEKVLVYSIFIRIHSYMPVIDQLEERVFSSAIPTFYTHNPLKSDFWGDILAEGPRHP